MSYSSDSSPSANSSRESDYRSSKRRRFRSVGMGFALVFTVGMLAHWPALISDGAMWDDWIVLSWIAQARFDWGFQFYHNYGVTPLILVHAPFILLTQDAFLSVLIGKIVYVAGTVGCGFLILLVSTKVARGNLVFGTVAGVAAVSFPGWSGEGFHVGSIGLVFFIPLFLTGILLFIVVASSMRRRPVIRSMAIIALFLSFTVNSLLVVFYAIMPAVFYASLGEIPQNLRALINNMQDYVFKHIDFFALPLIFWVCKQTFMPREGIYARYNAPTLDWSGIFDAYLRLVPDMLQSTVIIPFSIPIGVGIAATAFVVVCMRRKSKLALIEANFEVDLGRITLLFGFGFILLLATALPYYLVGRRSIEIFGFMSRDNGLFPLSIGWISAALLLFLLNARSLPRMPFQHGAWPLWRKAVVGAFCGLILAQCVLNWRNHAEWQAHYAYYRSVIEKIAHDQIVQDASVIHVIDRLPGDRTLKSRKYPTSIWTTLISSTFEKVTRLVIPFPPQNEIFYTRAEIARRILETEVDFMLEGIDADGPQIRLIVEPGLGAQEPVSLALAYWRARFFAPDDIRLLVDSLTQVRVEPIIKE